MLPVLKWAHRLLNLFLLLVFLLLALTAASFFADISISVPLYLKGKIEGAASVDGFEIEAKNMRLRLNGGLDFDGLKISFKDSKAPLFTADKLGVDFKIFTMAAGKFELRNLRLRNAAVYSGFGANSQSAVLEKIILDISKSGAYYKIACPSVNFENLSADIRGRVHEKFLLKNIGGGGSEKNPYKAWDDFCASAHSLKGWIGKFDRPFVSADFEIGAGGNLSAKLAARSGAAALSLSGKEIKISALKTECLLEKNSDLFNAKFGFKALNPACGEEISAKDLCVWGGANLAGEGSCGLALSVLDLNFYNAKIEYAQAEKEAVCFSEFNDAQSLNLDGLRAFFKIGGGNFSAQFGGNPRDFNVDFGGNLLPEELMKCSLIPPAEELKLFKFSRRGAFLFGRAGVKIPPENPPEICVSAFLDIPCATLFGVEVQSLSGGLTYDHASGEFWANDAFAVSDEGWSLSAQIYQNLKNYDYKFFFTGSLRPAAIDHLMEKWWVEIFGEFKFDKSFPHTDIAVHGTWGKPEIMYVYGDVWLENAYRGGVKFDKASLSVWVNPSRICIYNLNVENQ
ncbi:MAG: hypothetical protein IKO42_07815, partial [Opitutales bacterium]|nr:hypothetical protein [Opitutales bacterium]